MIGRVCLLLEALSIVICLHHLYGEKFKLDIKTVGFLAVDMIIMEFINHYELSKSYTMIIYPIIILYCGVRFGFKIRALIVNNILYMAIVSGIQLITVMLYYNVFSVQNFGNITLLIVNGMSFMIILLILSKCRLNKISLYLQDRERLLISALVVCIALVSYFLVGYKGNNGLKLYESILVFASLGLIVVLVVRFEKIKIKAKEIETELKMHELYADSFSNLIENIRLRQHEFDNHINTIYSQHLLFNTYEELVENQRKYCRALEQENRFNKLLKADNCVIRGFLYSKFIEIDKTGIEVFYKISIDKLDIKIPVYKIVEILGDLINNAVEAMEKEKNERKLFVSLVEINECVEIEVRNISKVIPHKDIQYFFNKGYSQKGSNRGLGLYNVKKICDEYEFSIMYDNKIIDNLNWLTFIITNKKK